MSQQQKKCLRNFTDLGFGDLPVCMAKHSILFSDDQTKLDVRKVSTFMYVMLS